MSSPYLSEIRIVSFNLGGKAPKGWAFCNGQLLAIQQNAALFSLLGAAYGGDGRSNFALPDLQGRMPVHVGNGIVVGQRGGEATHTLITQEMPQHIHPLAVTTVAANQAVPTNNVWAANGFSSYSTVTPNASANANAIRSTGGSQAHDNMPPYLVLNFIIALQGIFPSST